jgi:soluble cytochrome b562
MKTHVRALAVATATLAFGWWFLAAGNSGAADDKANVREAVQKVAEAVEKGDADQVKKLAAEIGKDYELQEVMYLMKNRDSKGKAKGYFGVGKEPGVIKPDGIEAKITNLSKPKPQNQIAKEADALAEMGYRIAAISEIAKAKPSEKANNAKKKKEWEEFADAMRKSADELAEAAKAKNAKALVNAAKKAQSSCNNCHGSFRDD